MKSTLIAVCGLSSALIAVHPALAKDKPEGPKEIKAGAVVPVASAAPKPAAVVKGSSLKQTAAGLEVAIAPYERHVIRTYVHNCIEASKGRRPNGLPPGLAKETAWGWGRALPPEWRKKCVQGAVLPSEVHKHCQPLPDQVMIKLPPPPPGTILLAVDGTVVRLAYPGYKILDVFNVL
jgi:hypothetical protein